MSYVASISQFVHSPLEGYLACFQSLRDYETRSYSYSIAGAWAKLPLFLLVQSRKSTNEELFTTDSTDLRKCRARSGNARGYQMLKCWFTEHCREGHFNIILLKGCKNSLLLVSFEFWHLLCVTIHRSSFGEKKQLNKAKLRMSMSTQLSRTLFPTIPFPCKS